MTNRRSFFKRLASLVAVVALAPEIAFSRKLETQQALNLDELFNQAHERFRYQNQFIDVMTDKLTAAKLQDAIGKYYRENYESRSGNR